MIALRLPSSGLSAEYGDIILSEVTAPVELSILVDTVEILSEKYYADANGVVTIRSIGDLAMDYFTRNSLALGDGVDGEPVVLSFEAVSAELGGTVTITEDITIYPSSVDFAGSVSASMILKMPLSRVSVKNTAAGRKEFVSFYDGTDVKLYAVYSNGTKDVGVTISDFAEPESNGEIVRFDVSPDVVATAVGCDVADLLYYNVYVDEEYIIRFKMDERSFHTQNTFVFRNCFGAQEAFTTVGDVEESDSWTRVIGFVNDKSVDAGIDLEKKVTVNTGFLNANELDVVEDMLSSSQVAIYQDGELRDIIILEDDYKKTSRKSELNQVVFTYKLAQRKQIRKKYVSLAKPGLFTPEFDQTFE